MKHHILYIPGVGDAKVDGQQKLMKLFRLHGVEAEVFQMHWTVDEPYDSKQKRIIERIMKLRSQGKVVSLLGFSAGASAALNTFKAVPKLINAVVTISGIVKGSVNPRYYANNPAFHESMVRVMENTNLFTPEQKSRMLVVGSLLDTVVPLRLATIPGVKYCVLPSIGHAGTLIFAVIFSSWTIANFVKRQAR